LAEAPQATSGGKKFHDFSEYEMAKFHAESRISKIFEAYIYDTVLYNYFSTEIIGDAFCIVCSTNLNIGGAFAPPAAPRSVPMLQCCILEV